MSEKLIEGPSSQEHQQSDVLRIKFVDLNIN